MRGLTREFVKVHGFTAFLKTKIVKSKKRRFLKSRISAFRGAGACSA